MEPPPARLRPLATGRQWVACLTALAVIGGGTVGLRVWDEVAWTQYADVRAEYELASGAAGEAAQDLTSRLRAAADALGAAETTSASAEGFVGESELAQLDEQRAAFEAVLEQSSGESRWQPQRIAPLTDTALLWEVLGDTARLSEASVDLVSDRERLGTVAAQVRTATDALNRDAVAVINAAGEIGMAELAKYPSATNHSYRVLKEAAEGAAALTRMSSRTTGLVADIVEARNAMAASHALKEDAKSGPLHTVRDEVEAFARSIAGGVRIDFTWQDIVIGHGQGRTAAGTATWDTADSGYSSITLTNSIARYWTSWAGYRSLVAHEVGHAITSKCYDLFSGSLFNGDNERWATAWAIGMGYTVSEANGSTLYGAPSQEQIDATLACR